MIFKSSVLNWVSVIGCALLVRGAQGSGQDTHNALEHIQLFNAVDETSSHRARVAVNVTEVAGKSAWVEVTWSGFKTPSFDDWLGVLAPADAHVKDSTPVKYVRASETKSHLKHGRGSVTFLLENHRTDLRVGFFYNGFKSPRLAGESETIRFLHPDIPSHGRLSLTGDNTEMLVQWTTATDKPGYVLWGTDSDTLHNKVASKLITYTRDEMCGGAAKHEGWLHPGFFHSALLTGLTPGRSYFYRFGGDEVGLSKTFSFAAAPEVSADTSVSILLIADMGQGEPDGSMEQSEMVPSLDTTRLLIRDAFGGRRPEKNTPAMYQMVAHFGDISYARGHVSQWDRYHYQIEPLVARLPYMVADGNHERDWPGSGDRFPSQTDSGGECGVAHERRFLMPTEHLDEPWFAYSFGPVRFIHYSTEHHFRKGSKQHDFVKAALAAVDRSITPWVVFAGHRPMYIDSTNRMKPDGDITVALDLQEAFADLLIEHGVDITFHGHHHSYQRTCPLDRDGSCAGFDNSGGAKGPVHLVIGYAGAGLCLNVHKHTPAIFEKVHLWWGYSRMHANATHLHIEAVTNLDGSVFDTVTLSKPLGWGEQWHQQHGAPSGGPGSYTTGRPKWWWEGDSIPPSPQLAHMRAAGASSNAAAHTGREKLRRSQMLSAQDIQTRAQ